MFLKHRRIKRILPFLGISLIFFYWSSVFNHTFHIRESLTCYNSRGYLAVRDLMTKEELHSLLHNCSQFNFDKESVQLVQQPSIIFTKNGITKNTLIIDPSELDLSFDQNVGQYDDIYSAVSFKYQSPKFISYFSRNVSFHREGLTFSTKQKIELHEIDSDFNIIVRFVVPIIAFLCIFSRKVTTTTILPIIVSSIVILMHCLFYGKYLPIFRLILSISWIYEFGLMIGLHIRGYVVAVPILILTLSVALVFFSVMYKSSRWFRHLQSGYLATISLMVGDHVMEMMTSFGGSSYPLYLRFGSSCILIIILVFVVLSSVGSPFKHLIHGDEQVLCPHEK